MWENLRREPERDIKDKLPNIRREPERDIKEGSKIKPLLR
jgi:hypothetical protein